MSDCADWFEELTHEVDVVLDEDLAALQRLPEQTRIERYNTLKTNEEELLWTFGEECPEFLTETERARVRGDFRLARLLIAASFYADDDLPRTLADDFVEAELLAVVDFDRYKQFDALSESQIEQRIRRMDGEVYELAAEYTSTQIANVEELFEHPDIQQDLLQRLLSRYEKRREKIRRGFFTYVETHGIEHMVEAIEDAVLTVNESATEREQVQMELRSDLAELAEILDERLGRRRRHLETELHSLEREFADRTADSETLQSDIETLKDRTAELSETQESVLGELQARIEQTTGLENRIEVKIEELEETRERAARAATESVEEQVVTLVENELEALHEHREQLREEIAHLEREREQVEAARDSLEDRQDSLESRVSDVEQSLTTGKHEGGIEGENVVPATMARVMEMDYLGRFDISMHETPSIRTHDRTLEIPDGYWEERSQRHNHYSQLLDLLDTETDDPGAYPANEAARYEITSSRYLFARETEMVVEARVVADLEAYATSGFATRPADLDDLLAIVNQVVAEAEAGEYRYLLGLASPTGWTERVRNRVVNDDFARTRFSQYSSICLVNLQDGSLIYDESDPVLCENADLFAPPIDAERLEECVETIRDEFVNDLTRETVLVDDLVDEFGYDAHIVKQAFNRLEADGAGEQLYLDELGLGLDLGV